MKLEANTRGAWMSVIPFDQADAEAVRAAAHLLGHCAGEVHQNVGFRIIDDYGQVSEFWTPLAGWRIKPSM